LAGDRRGEVPPTPGATPVRALAVVLVGYSYLGALWAVRHGHPATWVVDMVREWLNGPLGLGEDFGFLGLALLLVLFGASLPARSVAEGGRAALLRLVARGYPPLACAVTVAAALLAMGAEPLTEPARAVPTARGYLANLVLVADLADGHTNLVPLAWVVTVAAGYVGLVLATLPLLRRRPWLAVLVQLAVAGAVLAGAAGHQLSVLASYLPLPILGELVWAARTRRLRPWLAGVLGLAAWSLLVLAGRLDEGLAQWWYPLATVYAVPLVMLLGRAEALARGGLLRWLASRCYPLVLLVGVLGYPLLGLCDGRLTAWLAYPAALLVTAGGAELCHRFVVLPCAALVVRVSAPRTPAPVAEPT
jgi:peptidoglycan/LPS O-acetylase OafA/YrhL